jgi:1-acyl-sn-glycerol-3-phosphate acyltransferase
MTSVDVPQISPWFQNGFHRFLRSFLKRHFHSIAIERQSRCDQLLSEHVDQPLIVYANHPSWWDPLVGHFFNATLLSGRQFYAPIDADALEQYRVFAKLGFYGVRLHTKAGAAAFLKQSMAILHSGNAALWITPEGHFADVRDHSAPLMPGLAHLCTRLDNGWVLPLALEYAFWEERLPECIFQMGAPIDVSAHANLSKPEWNELVTARLRETQTSLAQHVIARSAEPFDNLLHGKRGGGLIYDSLRRLKALVTGRKFRAAHGEQFE